MILPKGNDKQADVNLINICDKKTHDSILQRQLTKTQLSSILHRIKSLLRKQKQPQILNNLTQLKKELRSKYSINLSNDIIDHFIMITQKVNSPRSELDFNCIEKEIKNSLGEIHKKKYYLNNQNKKITFTKKILSAEKRKRRNIFNNITSEPMPQIRSMKNFDQIFIREKLTIFQDYLQEEQISKFQAQLQKKVEAIGHLNYGRYVERIKHYTVYDLVLQKVFTLIQEDTKNIEIRTKFQNIYKKMKEEMISIVTNEEDITNTMKKLKNRSQENIVKNASKNHAKKNYFQLEREKQDLTSQIEETFEGAKKHLKEAFIKRGRPDFAYEMELMVENRKMPIGPKRIRF